MHRLHCGNLQQGGGGKLHCMSGGGLQRIESFLLHELHRGHLRGHSWHDDVHLMQLWTLAAAGGPDVMRQVHGGPEPERHGTE